MNLTRRDAILAAIGASALALPVMAKEKDQEPDAALDVLKELLKAHDKAFSSHDMDGVLATLSKDCVLMGTAPGELWIGHDEIRGAYEHFFEGFDEGGQKFEHVWYDGNIGPAGAWFMAMSKVTIIRDAEQSEFGLNLSLNCEKHDGKWKIRSMHFSNATDGSK